jgi:hypothetical protein
MRPYAQSFFYGDAMTYLCSNCMQPLDMRLSCTLSEPPFNHTHTISDVDIKHFPSEPQKPTLELEMKLDRIETANRYEIDRLKTLISRLATRLDVLSELVNKEKKWNTP